MVETAQEISSLSILETEISVFGSCEEAVHLIGKRIALRAKLRELGISQLFWHLCAPTPLKAYRCAPAGDGCRH